MGIVVLVLLSCLAGAVFMGYRGYGVVEAGPGSAGSPSVRGGSIFAPDILGGGPGSGK